MDMYQKREQRKNNELEDNKSLLSTNINWDMSTYRQPHSSPYEIRKIEKYFITYALQKKKEGIICYHQI